MQPTSETIVPTAPSNSYKIERVAKVQNSSIATATMSSNSMRGAKLAPEEPTSSEQQQRKRQRQLGPIGGGYCANRRSSESARNFRSEPANRSSFARAHSDRQSVGRERLRPRRRHCNRSSRNGFAAVASASFAFTSVVVLVSGAILMLATLAATAQQPSNITEPTAESTLAGALRAPADMALAAAKRLVLAPMSSLASSAQAAAGLSLSPFASPSSNSDSNSKPNSKPNDSKRADENANSNPAMLPAQSALELDEQWLPKPAQGETRTLMLAPSEARRVAEQIARWSSSQSSPSSLPSPSNRPNGNEPIGAKTRRQFVRHTLPDGRIVTYEIEDELVEPSASQVGPAPARPRELVAAAEPSAQSPRADEHPVDAARSDLPGARAPAGSPANAPPPPPQPTVEPAVPEMQQQQQPQQQPQQQQQQQHTTIMPPAVNAPKPVGAASEPEPMANGHRSPLAPPSESGVQLADNKTPNLMDKSARRSPANNNNKDLSAQVPMEPAHQPDNSQVAAPQSATTQQQQQQQQQPSLKLRGVGNTRKMLVDNSEINLAPAAQTSAHLPASTNDATGAGTAKPSVVIEDSGNSDEVVVLNRKLNALPLGNNATATAQPQAGELVADDNNADDGDDDDEDDTNGPNGANAPNGPVHNAADASGQPSQLGSGPMDQRKPSKTRSKSKSKSRKSKAKRKGAKRKNKSAPKPEDVHTVTPAPNNNEQIGHPNPSIVSAGVPNELNKVPTLPAHFEQEQPAPGLPANELRKTTPDQPMDLHMSQPQLDQHLPEQHPLQPQQQLDQHMQPQQPLQPLEQHPQQPIQPPLQQPQALPQQELHQQQVPLSPQPQLQPLQQQQPHGQVVQPQLHMVQPVETLQQATQPQQPLPLQQHQQQQHTLIAAAPAIQQQVLYATSNSASSLNAANQHVVEEHKTVTVEGNDNSNSNNNNGNNQAIVVPGSETHELRRIDGGGSGGDNDAGDIIEEEVIEIEDHDGGDGGGGWHGGRRGGRRRRRGRGRGWGRG